MNPQEAILSVQDVGVRFLYERTARPQRRSVVCHLRFFRENLFASWGVQATAKRRFLMWLPDC